jgi:putative hemolysin
MDILDRLDVEKITALKQLPPLIKAYIRLGGYVGNGASIDADFNSIDVCLIMDTKNMSEKYKKLYSQGVN